MLVTVDQALKLLRDGEVVAYPTETFYALGVDASNRAALKRLHRLKGRSLAKALPVLIPSVDYLPGRLALDSQLLGPLISAFWPGPLTLVLPTLGSELRAISRRGQVGVRLSAHPEAGKLLQRFGGAITSTSANLSGGLPTSEPDEIALAFGEALPIIDGGRTPGEIASTIVRLQGRSTMVVLRQGPTSLEMMERVLQCSGCKFNYS